MAGIVESIRLNEIQNILHAVILELKQRMKTIPQLGTSAFKLDHSFPSLFNLDKIAFKVSTQVCINKFR